MLSCIFFFSSRRRHTRFKCDWSSDVCSSDLSGTLWLRFRERYLIGMAGKVTRDQAEAVILHVAKGLPLPRSSGLFPPASPEKIVPHKGNIFSSGEILFTPPAGRRSA